MAHFETLPENVDLLTSKVMPPDHIKWPYLKLLFSKFESLSKAHQRPKLFETRRVQYGHRYIRFAYLGCLISVTSGHVNLMTFPLYRVIKKMSPLAFKSNNSRPMRRTTLPDTAFERADNFLSNECIHTRFSFQIASSQDANQKSSGFCVFRFSRTRKYALSSLYRIWGSNLCMHVTAHVNISS